MYADAAVLIPQLLEGLPFGVFATSSIDALVHAVESSLSPKATPYTKLFGYKAIEMLIGDIRRSPGRGGRPACPCWRLPDCVELCGLCIRYGWVRGGARHELPAGGKYHVPTGEQLRDVYRRVEELHGDQAGRRACGDEPLSGGGRLSDPAGSLFYIERTQSDGKVRHGLIGMVDLDQYDFTPGSGA